jgi:hypothetical protein
MKIALSQIQVLSASFKVSTCFSGFQCGGLVLQQFPERHNASPAASSTESSVYSHSSSGAFSNDSENGAPIGIS